MVEINYIAVLVAGVASYAVGALWYGFLFQKKWMGLMGFTPDVVKTMKMTPAMSMILGFILTMVTVYVLAGFAAYLELMGVKDMLMLGLLVWVGFQLPILSHSVLYENRTVPLLLINAGHQLTATLVAALVLALF